MDIKKLQNSDFQVSSFSNIDPVPFCAAVARASDGSVTVMHSQDINSDNSMEFTKEEA